MSKPALIVIDVLNDFFQSPELHAQREVLVQSINQLAAAMRGHSFAVIWVRQEYAPDLSNAPLRDRERQRSVTIRGTEGCQLLPELIVEPEDHEVVKHRYSAFFQTDLESLLADLKASPLVLAGINTHACVRSTAVDAYSRDFPLILASDCIGSYDENWHRESMRYLEHSMAEAKRNSELITWLRNFKNQ